MDIHKLRTKRTDIDFSKHELIIKKNEDILIHYLKKPNTGIDSIKYINTSSIMAVTGDYGNWIFCREFHPSKEGYVSDGYWLEKLSIASSQEGEEFNSEDTRKEIEEGLKVKLEEYGYEGEELQQARDYYNELLRYVDLSESEYTSFAYNNQPGFMDSEEVPHCKTTKSWLEVVFDGFNEICNRLGGKK